jgi:pilus assembly protein CpaD
MITKRLDPRRLALPCLLGLVLAACSTPYQKDPSTLAPSETFPLGVESQTLTFEVAGDGRGGLLPAEALRLDRFVDEYAVNGQGTLVVSTPLAHGVQGDRLAIAIAEHALARGLARPEVGIAETGENGGPVVVSFERYLVRLPDCAGWNVEPSYNPSNSPHINFGCATQRNLGMMVANPADLIAPAGQGGVLDTIRSDLVVQNYRKGELTQAKTAEELSATASQVSNQ